MEVSMKEFIFNVIPVVHGAKAEGEAMSPMSNGIRIQVKSNLPNGFGENFLFGHGHLEG
jgi:hypothetical protein